MNGVALIAAERKRQIESEGWTPEHDDEHNGCELAAAAACYAELASRANHSNPHTHPEWLWPFSGEWWKPSPDPIRNLVKAGALIAAEIDRRLRAAPSTEQDREKGK